MREIIEILDEKLKEHRKATETKRKYLGASSIGDFCLRKIQLQYMQDEPELPALTLRAFDIGHALEPVVAEWLRIAGFRLKTLNDRGEQFGFSVAGGRIAGHIDGVVCAGPGCCRYPCLWECKTMKHESWSGLNRHGLLVANPMYYAQIQLYMAYVKLDENPCLFTVLDKNTSELYIELVPFDPETAQRYSDRAALVIQATERGETLPCISGDPSFHKCKVCDHRQTCFSERGFNHG
jgi:hypothetical protein